MIITVLAIMFLIIIVPMAAAFVAAFLLIEKVADRAVDLALFYEHEPAPKPKSVDVTAMGFIFRIACVFAGFGFMFVLIIPV